MHRAYQQHATISSNIQLHVMNDSDYSGQMINVPPEPDSLARRYWALSGRVGPEQVRPGRLEGRQGCANLRLEHERPGRPGRPGVADGLLSTVGQHLFRSFCME